MCPAMKASVSSSRSGHTTSGCPSPMMSSNVSPCASQTTSYSSSTPLAATRDIQRSLPGRPRPGARPEARHPSPIQALCGVDAVSVRLLGAPCHGAGELEPRGCSPDPAAYRSELERTASGTRSSRCREERRFRLRSPQPRRWSRSSSRGPYSGPWNRRQRRWPSQCTCHQQRTRRWHSQCSFSCRPVGSAIHRGAVGAGRPMVTSSRLKTCTCS